MRKVDQTIVGGRGNCLAASVASVLGVTLAQVPDLRGPRWTATLDRWLLGSPWRARAAPELPPGFTGHVVALGVSPRRRGHAVVWAPGVGMVHDPHPSRAGLVGTPDGYLWFERR